jgi:hypothetical protein
MIMIAARYIRMIHKFEQLQTYARFQDSVECKMYLLTRRVMNSGL